MLDAEEFGTPVEAEIVIEDGASSTGPTDLTASLDVIESSKRDIESTAPRRLHRSRRAFVCAAIALVGLGIAVVTGCSSEDDRATRPSTTVTPNLGFPEPTSETAKTTLAYLERDGRVLRVVHNRASALTRAKKWTPERCRRVVAALDEIATPDEVLVMIDGVTDAVLRAALHDERSKLGLALTTCVSGTPERSPQLVHSVERVRVRLAELEGAT